MQNSPLSSATIDWAAVASTQRRATRARLGIVEHTAHSASILAPDAFVAWSKERQQAVNTPSLQDGMNMARYQAQFKACKADECQCLCKCHSGQFCSSDSDSRFHMRLRSHRS